MLLGLDGECCPELNCRDQADETEWDCQPAGFLAVTIMACWNTSWSSKPEKFRAASFVPHRWREKIE